MADFQIHVDLSGLLELPAIAESQIFQSLAAAVERVTIIGAERWKDAVRSASLWEGERQAYINSIQWRMTGQFSGEITSNYKYVEDIETGRPAYDLKKMLDTSLKVRVNAKGQRYLIIPFRHNTPGNDALARPMPDEIYREAAKLSPSTITGLSLRRSGTGAFDPRTKQRYVVRQLRYQWGDSLAAGLAPKLKPSHATDIYAGMHKFNTSSGKQTSSAYITFRVMKEGSPGWIIGAKPGLFIARKITDGLKADAETIFRDAIIQDALPG